MHSPEPRFSRIAAVIADPSRARMLAALLGGEYRSAGELATAAGITAQAASTQLAQLLAMVAERDNVSTRWDKPAYKPLKCARRCYGHMAGELGVAQFEMLMRKHYLEPYEHGLQLTGAGRAWAAQLGVELPGKSTPRFAYPCMDWSERKDHLAGSLAKALLERYVAKGWLSTSKDTRALELTPLGQQMLRPLLLGVLA
jgi:DNA-binding transcriptional ArsR family regulator